MNERIKELMEQSMPVIDWKARYGVELNNGERLKHMTDWFEKFAELVINDCIDKIETYRIPVGNSPAGEMACEWTYEALKEIRDEIKEHFGVEK
jgi:hypothetical protein